MLKGFRAIKPFERRDTWTAFAMLFLFIASHAVLETARDALFLSNVPATQLPWMYMAIAVVSLGATQLQAQLSGRMRVRRALGLWTVLVGLVTGGFWLGLTALGEGGVYALYIWSGVLTTLVLVHFWTLLGDVFSVTQAKRLFGVVGAGSVFGAIVGSGVAGAVSRVTDPRHLLLVAALGFCTAGLTARLFSDGTSGEARAKGEKEASNPAHGLWTDARYVFDHMYARRVVQIMLIAAAALTLTDFLFKSAIVKAVEPAELGATLGTIYFALNVASLFVQLTVVNYVLRRFDLIKALSVLPGLLLIGAVAVSAVPLVPAIVAALMLKGPDGALRYTLHRTSSELLFVPLSDGARRKVKAFIDVVGQRGGQAIASIAILTLSALSLPLWASGIVLVLLLVGWLVSVLRMRSHYLELFRGRLRHNQLAFLSEFPDLDIASLETLVAALDSDSVPEVVAALDVLERENKSHLVPGLILYHPAEQVVVRAVEVFARSRRKNVLRAVDRLFDHASPRVRAAAIGTRTAIEPDAKKLSLQLSLEDSPEVRATIVVNLIAMGEIIGKEADDRIADFVAKGSVETRVAMAEAISRQPSSAYRTVLVNLSSADEPEVSSAALKAMAAANLEEFLPTIVKFVGSEKTRVVAMQALLAFDERGFQIVVDALGDLNQPDEVRWQLPRVIAMFDPQRAAEALVARLSEEGDGMVRYRITRALENIRAHTPDVRLDVGVLDAVIDDTIGRAYRYLDRRVTLEAGAKSEEARATPGHHLLAQLLKDKQTHAQERIFRLLGLVYPREDFRHISSGLTSKRREIHASSIELLENVLSGDRRRAVVGLVEELPDKERLENASAYHRPLALDYVGLLGSLLDSSSDALTDITAFHIGELGIVNLGAKLKSLPATPDIELALERIAKAGDAEGASTSEEEERSGAQDSKADPQEDAADRLPDAPKSVEADDVS